MKLSKWVLLPLLSLTALLWLTPADAAYRSSSTNSGSSTSPSTALPAGTTTDDIVLLAFSFDQQPLVTVTWPSGFTELISRNITADGQTFRVAWKRATGSEPGTYTITTSASSTPDWVCQAVTLSGRDTGGSVVSVFSDAGSNTLASSPLTLAATGITAPSNSDLVFIAAADPNGATTSPSFTAPASYTERQDTERLWAGMTIATRDNQSGATGTVSGTGTLVSGQAGWGAFLISVAPSGGSPATLSSATPSGTLGTSTTATLGATTDVTSGTFYGVVDPAGSISGITAAQVKAAQDNGGGAVVASCNASVSTTTPSCGVTGLTASTAYGYAVVQNSAGGDSNVLTGTFTTAAGGGGTNLLMKRRRH